MKRKDIKKIQRKTDPIIKKLIQDCNELGKKSKFWKKIAKELLRSTRRQRKINLYKLNKITKPNEQIIIPGKLLGTGELKHNLKIFAFKYSQSVKNKIKELYSIQELIKKNPEGKGIRIIC